MKRYMPVFVVCGLVVGLVSIGKGQAPATNKTRPPTSSSAASPAGANNNYGVFEGSGSYDGHQDEIGQARSQVKRLVNELRNEEDAAKKKDLATQLEESVTKVFDQDLSAREAELKQLEERLKKLRSQQEKRRQARSEIIQLQLRILSNEAEGLGFSGGDSLIESSNFGMGPYPRAPGTVRSPVSR